jgi:hypothetical protein
MARLMDVALRIAEQPWRWGESDCCTFACDVFREVYGIDPMSYVRGTYDSAASAARLIQSRGGMDLNVRKTLRDAGLVPCEPREGALGVVTDSGGVKVAAICAGPGVWLVRTANGISSRAQASEVHHVAD